MDRSAPLCDEARQKYPLTIAALQAFKAAGQRLDATDGNAEAMAAMGNFDAAWQNVVHVFADESSGVNHRDIVLNMSWWCTGDHPPFFSAALSERPDPRRRTRG